MRNLSWENLSRLLHSGTFFPFWACWSWLPAWLWPPQCWTASVGLSLALKYTHPTKSGKLEPHARFRNPRTTRSGSNGNPKRKKEEWKKEKTINVATTFCLQHQSAVHALLLDQTFCYFLSSYIFNGWTSLKQTGHRSLLSLMKAQLSLSLAQLSPSLFSFFFGWAPSGFQFVVGGYFWSTLHWFGAILTLNGKFPAYNKDIIK